MYLTKRNTFIVFAIGTLLLIAVWILILIFVTVYPLSSSVDIVSFNDKLQLKFGSTYQYQQNKSIAWKKFLNGTGTMILIHARKAAGTTMDKWMTLFIEDKLPYWTSKIRNITWQCKLIKIEAFTNVNKNHGHINFIEYTMNKYPFALYVISLRDPIKRILSQYNFEWRWGCIRCGPQRTYMQYNKLNKMNKTTYMKKIDNKYRINVNDKKFKYSNIDFHNFIDRITMFELNKFNNTDLPKDGNHVRSFGSYINNYYLWMFCCRNKFCNIYKDFERKNKIEQCYNNAMQKIMKFDIVLISEWLNDIRIQLYVNKLLFGEMYKDEMFVPLTVYPFPHRIVDRGRNYMIDKVSKKRLNNLNIWDLELYKFTKELVYNRLKVLF